MWDPPQRASGPGSPLGQLQGPGDCVRPQRASGWGMLWDRGAPEVALGPWGPCGDPQRASGLERLQALGWLWGPGDHEETPKGFSTGDASRPGCGVPGDRVGTPKGFRTREVLGPGSPWGSCGVPGDCAGPPQGLQDWGCFGTWKPLGWLWGPGDRVETPKVLQDRGHFGTRDPLRTGVPPVPGGGQQPGGRADVQQGLRASASAPPRPAAPCPQTRARRSPPPRPSPGLRPPLATRRTSPGAPASTAR